MDKTKLEEDNKELVDMYFEGVDVNTLDTLENTIKTYLANTKLNESPFRAKQPDRNLFFVETIGDRKYKGFIKVNYWNYNRHSPPLGKCLYITHVAITPIGGNILDRALKKVLNDSELIDSLFIESILSDKVVSRFVVEGWTQDRDTNNVYLRKEADKLGGKGKRKQKTSKKRNLSKRKKSSKKR